MINLLAWDKISLVCFDAMRDLDKSYSQGHLNSLNKILLTYIKIKYNGRKL